MMEYSFQNKKAWEYSAYDFWVKEAGLPADRAKKILEDSWAGPSIPGEFTIIADKEL